MSIVVAHIDAARVFEWDFDEADVYVEVPDMTDARVDELEGTRLWSPFHTSDSTALGRFADPEGHLIGLISTIG